MEFKFEKLEVWQLAIEYLDLLYGLAAQLPASEDYNLKSQIIRAGTSLALNIAEGSTSQTDAEQRRFLKIAIRSLLETIACQILIRRRNYCDQSLLVRVRESAEKLFAKLQAFNKSLQSVNDS